MAYLLGQSYKYVVLADKLRRTSHVTRYSYVCFPPCTAQGSHYALNICETTKQR